MFGFPARRKKRTGQKPCHGNVARQSFIHHPSPPTLRTRSRGPLATRSPPQSVPAPRSRPMPTRPRMTGRNRSAVRIVSPRGNRAPGRRRASGSVHRPAGGKLCRVSVPLGAVLPARRRTPGSPGRRSPAARIRRSRFRVRLDSRRRGRFRTGTEHVVRDLNCLGSRTAGLPAATRRLQSRQSQVGDFPSRQSALNASATPPGPRTSSGVIEVG